MTSISNTSNESEFAWTVDRRWHGFPFRRHAPGFHSHLDDVVMPESMLWVMDEGHAALKWRDGGSPRSHRLVPETAVFWRKGHRLTDIDSVGPSISLAMMFPDDQVDVLLEDEAESARRRLRSVGPHLFRMDAFVLHAMRAIGNELASGCPSGAVFAESFSISMLSYLLGHWSSPSNSVPPNGAVRAVHIRLCEFIEENLGDDLSLVTLSKVVGLSPRHAARNFKLTSGISLHQYILERRIERAKLLLKHRSVTDVAMSTGFASHSHFSGAFKRATGVSPSVYSVLQPGARIDRVA